MDDNLSDRLNELGTSHGRLATTQIRRPDPTDQSPQGGFEMNTILYICTAFHGGARRSGMDRRWVVNEAVADAIALGRAGVPDKIGPMTAALLSDDNRRANTQRVEVSGGILI